ncbi:MAG: hypothetical protein ACRDTG_10600 [Pseudonocardiaceae bacterium]
MQRGEIWAYQPVLQRPGQSLLRLIVSADGLNVQGSLPIVLGLQVVDRDPGSLLAVRLEGYGWTVVTTIEAVIRRRLPELVGVIGSAEQVAVDSALRAALEL